MEDKGHIDLIANLSDLLERAKAYEFHDFKSERTFPKHELYRALMDMANKTTSKEYDN